MVGRVHVLHAHTCAVGISVCVSVCAVSLVREVMIFIWPAIWWSVQESKKSVANPSGAGLPGVSREVPWKELEMLSVQNAK